MKRNRAKAYRTIARLQVKTQASHRTVQRVQKRNERTGKRVSSLEEKKTKKQLTFHKSVLEDLKAKYGAMCSDRQRQTMAKYFLTVFLRNIVVSKLKSTIGVSHKIYCATMKLPNEFVYERKPRSDKLTASTVHLIKNFFQRDDNSSMTHGKKTQSREERSRNRRDC